MVDPTRSQTLKALANSSPGQRPGFSIHGSIWRTLKVFAQSLRTLSGFTAHYSASTQGAALGWSERFQRNCQNLLLVKSLLLLNAFGVHSMGRDWTNPGPSLFRPVGIVCCWRRAKILLFGLKRNFYRRFSSFACTLEPQAVN